MLTCLRNQSTKSLHIALYLLEKHLNLLHDQKASISDDYETFLAEFSIELVDLLETEYSKDVIGTVLSIFGLMSFFSSFFCSLVVDKLEIISKLLSNFVDSEPLFAANILKFLTNSMIDNIDNAKAIKDSLSPLFFPLFHPKYLFDSQLTNEIVRFFSVLKSLDGANKLICTPVKI